MQSGKTLLLFLVCLSSSTLLLADDPLNAMPSAAEPLAKKLEKLTPEQRQAISLPNDPKQIVLSFALETETNKKPEPWLTVTAAGFMDSHVPMPGVTQRRQEQLANEELRWLLHLAVNECQGFQRDTKTLRDDFSAKPSSFATGLPDNRLNYTLHLQGKAHEFSLPEAALVVRPVRTRMKLGAFASLQKFAMFLVSRAYLGTAEERVVLLNDLNVQLQQEQQKLHPLVVPPPFELEHLGNALSTDKTPLLATFVQEVPLGDKKYQKITATIVKANKDEKPQITIVSMPISKLR
jgi:hypothetical protein